MKVGMYVMTSELITAAYFINLCVTQLFARERLSKHVPATLTKRKHICWMRVFVGLSMQFLIVVG
jgi:hypothetical protein